MRLQPGLVMPGGLVPASAPALDGGKTYEEFVAHINSLGGTARGWLDDAFWSGAGVYVVVAQAAGGHMIGSPWLAPIMGAAGSTTTDRLVQHALPSELEFDKQIADERVILLRMSSTTAPSGYAAKDRNGYRSSSNASTTGSPRRCVELLAWIDGRPMKMQPSLGLGPVPYDW